MTDTTVPNDPSSCIPIAPNGDGGTWMDGLVHRFHTLSPGSDVEDRSETSFENSLALVRLGIATSLFYSLRAKHARSAAHCLRVALACSAWAERLGLDEATRDRIEVAALLHDIGKIGIPDRILRKPRKLTAGEQLVMDNCPNLGCEILRGCTSDEELLTLVRHANTWYKSRRNADDPHGNAIPLGSRMLSIAAAYDSMTTDSVYRPAMSQEKAIQELIDCSGTQFDEELVADFLRMLEERPETLQGAFVHRWLQQLQQPKSREVLGKLPQPSQKQSGASPSENLFFVNLMNNLKDGVAFTDAEGTVNQWNQGMQALTSISGEEILGHRWSNDDVRLVEHAGSLGDSTCPVQACVRTGTVISRAMLIQPAGDEPTPVHIQVSPVFGSLPGIQGTVIIIRDLSDRINLEEQVESLHRQTTRDPLTGAYNRIYFDQAVSDLVREAREGTSQFSLIICDIDHFKNVNDQHGHPAGDEALVSFAAILKSHSRDDDIVIRYGGEEFVLLTPNCRAASAVGKAESIRIAVENTSLPSLGGAPMTASFGVTEFQDGDSADTILARADRALLRAKEEGRNRVIQIGEEIQQEPVQQEPIAEPVKRNWRSWFDSGPKEQSREIELLTPVPMDLAIEKLRGFLADHEAEIIRVSEDQVFIKFNASVGTGGRRRSDNQIAMHAKFTLREDLIEVGKLPNESRRQLHTVLHVHLETIRSRNRRNQQVEAVFNHVFSTLKSYMMGKIQDDDRS